jgi:lipopolysaccharide transport system ATP-binding protein
VSVPGRVASILELGSAFHPEVSGRRNVVLQAALAGLTQSEAEAALPEIEAFADLGAFFDRAVKTYSSGMQMRLAFAVATAVLPDVVILDEALAVGDGRFQKKCVDRIHELKASGRTILFCSHALYFVTTLCDRAIWLRSGTMAAEGDAHRVVLEYERYLAAKEGEEAAAQPPVARTTHGKFTMLTLIGEDGRPRNAFRPGERWTLEMEFVSDDTARVFQVHVGVATRDQVNCFAADSRQDGVGPFTGKSRYRMRLSLPQLPLAKGEFVVHAYLADDRALALYDARTDLSFHVESERWCSGLLDLHPEWDGLDADEPSLAVAGERESRS